MLARLLPGLLTFALLTGCGASSRVWLRDSDPSGFRGGPVAARPGGEEILYMRDGQIVAVHRERGRLDHLLLEADPTLIDMAFRSPEKLLVLKESGVAIYYAGRLIHAWEMPVSRAGRIAAKGCWRSSRSFT